MAFLQIVLAAGIWGAAYPLTKGALFQVPPMILGFGRFAIASLVLMIYSRSLPLHDIRSEDRFEMISLAFWGSFVLVVGMNLGLRIAPAGIASIISGTPPLFTALFAYLWLGEPVSRKKGAALFIAFSGIIFLAGDVSLSGATWYSVFGVALVTLPQIAWAIYSVLGKRLLKTYHWVQVCRDTFSFGALMLFPVALIEGLVYGTGTWTASSLGVLLYLGLLNSVCTYGLWNRALAQVPVSLASFILYLQPVTGAIISYFMFGDLPKLVGWAGICLIFCGLTLVLREEPPQNN